MKSSNYYQLLGVSRDARQQEISEAYKDILLRLQRGEIIYHSRQELADAYNTLSRPERREEYDQNLPEGIFYYEATQVFDWDAHQKILQEVQNGSVPNESKAENLASRIETLADEPKISQVKEKATAEPKKKTLSEERTYSQDSINNFDSTPFANYYDEYFDRGVGTRRQIPVANSQKIDEVQTISDIISNRDRMINYGLLFLGLGLPVVTLASAALYFALK